MQPFVFWFGFLSLLLMDLIIFDRLQDPLVHANPMTWLFSSLFLLGTIALPWTYWLKRSAIVFARLAALVCTIMLALTVYAWLPAADVFIDCKNSCNPKVGTVWPLIFVWISAIGFFTFALWPQWALIRNEIKTNSAKAYIWYATLLTWTIACAVIFGKNISVPIILNSLSSTGKLIFYLAAILSGLVAIGFLANLPRLRKVRKARADFEAMNTSTKEEVLRFIDEQSRLGQHQLLYMSVDRAIAPTDLAKVGGHPLALSEESWPADSEHQAARFLMQMPLRAPRLPLQWRSRILTIFLLDGHCVVRSYDLDLQALQPLAPPLPDSDLPYPLEEIAVPFEPSFPNDADSTESFDSEEFFAKIPSLKAKLTKYSRHPKLLLGMLFGNSSLATELEPSNLILVGGEPHLIQNDHPARCKICDHPLRFLMQSCDVTENFELGDSGVIYIYGCDSHPDYCEAFVDTY